MTSSERAAFIDPGSEMSVGKVNEVIGSSPQSFEEAAQRIAARAHDTLRGVRGIEVLEKWVDVGPAGAIEYQVRVQLLFDMAPETVFQM